MKILLILLGIIWIAAGALLVILTDGVREVFKNILKQKNLKALSILPFIVGVILIFGSSEVSAPWIAIALGILALSKGLFFLFGPQKKSKMLIDWWLNTSGGILKMWGIIVFFFGVLLLLIL